MDPKTHNMYMKAVRAVGQSLTEDSLTGDMRYIIVFIAYVFDVDTQHVAIDIATAHLAAAEKTPNQESSHAST
jgi:hypothetical protein